ncbi:MAG: autotransporter-associated beta strand repeat-containing protein [Verrucomicrobia bacterium]|nr:autotransporter-associated beta strand repeat-containing protein [Verrucomicrobiota bacterium]
MKLLRVKKQPLGLTMIVFLLTWQIAQPLQAAAFYWDADASVTGNTAAGANLGGTGIWDATMANWWDTPNLVVWPNTNADQAIISGAFPALGIPTANTITLSSGIVANTLTFVRSGYTLTGGTLTLDGTTPTLHANLGESATINSQILGLAGLTKTGGGSVRLGNLGNAYTGVTTISNGSLIISDGGALGADSSAISILTNNNTPLNTNLLGFTGGSLVLDGTSGGFTLTRNVNFEGRGPIGDRGAAIQSLGSNTLSGTLSSAVSPLPLSPTATFRNSRINSVNGTLTLSGTLNVGGTVGTTFTNLGGVNSAGVGDFSLTGVIAGTGSIEKSGAGMLFLNPSSTSGFSGTVRISASSTGQQSSVRVTQASVGGTSIFGANTGTTTAAAIDLNGGVLEFRSDSDLNFGALASGKNVYHRSGSTVYTGPAAGGAGINGTTTLGTLQHLVSTTGSTATTTFNSRNGFGVTFSSMAVDASTSTSTLTNTLTNNMGGNLIFTGNTTLGDGNTASRPRVLAIGGTGNTVIQGSVIAGTDTGKTLTKSGAGNLTIQGVGTTVAGTISITAGAITVTDFRSLNNNTAAISLGNATTTGGNLIIGGTGITPTLAGLTTSKTITLNTTSGANSIYANQTGANPVILNGAITKIAAATSGALILGGTSTVDNIINVVIPVETTPSTGGVTKVGAGTWVLNAANTYAGATTIQHGTLKLRANAAASDVIKEAASNTIVFSANATTNAAGGTLEFRGFSGAATTETLGALTPTAGAATVRLLGNGGSAANLTFTSLGATTAASSVNFVTTGANGGVVTLTGQAATTATNLPGTANFLGHLYINGADFATINGSAQVVAPTYLGTGNFQNAASTLVASVHNKLTGSFTNGAATVSSLVTNSQTLTLSGNLVVSTGGILQSGGTATIQSDSGTARLINQTGTAATNVAIRVDQISDVLNLGTATNQVSIGSFTTGGLTKNGAGKLVFFGANAQTGTITVNEGIIELNGSIARLAALAGAATVVRQNASLDFNTAVAFAADPTVAALDGAGTIRNIGAANVNLVQTGAGTWAGSFNQTGSGVLSVSKLGTTGAPIWQGLSNYTGVTTIGGTTGSVTVDFLANGGQNSGIGASSNAASNLVFSGTTAGLIYRGSIIEGALTLGSRSATTDRLFTLSGSGATLTSDVSNNNAMIWSNTGAIVHGTDANRTLTLAGTSTGDNTFNPQLSNSTGFITSLSKTGAGQWNLGNTNNTYTGITTLSEGILALNDNGAFPTNSPLLLAPSSATSVAVFQMSGTFDRNLAATATAGTGTVTFGGATASTTGGVGFAAHSNALIVAIGGVGSPTALTWGAGGFVGTGAVQNLVLNSTTALSSVDFRNAINLGALARTINVLDNGNTGADFATMSGVLSGAGGSIIKIGSGVLRLTGGNTYTGTTTVEAGTLVVSSFGSSTGSASSGVGAGGVAMDNSNAIVLGNATTTGGILQYVGSGEISDRKIRLRGTTASNQIHADGSGPLILTNVAHDTTETGNKTLSLRGSNAAGNMITSQLSDNVAGVLSVTVDGGATWILTNSANNYTGTTTASGGALGIGHDTAIPAALTISNGNVFAYGEDRTFANTLNLGNNATSGFIGDYSLTFNGTNNLAAGANNLNLYNSMVAGEALTLNGLLANSLGATRAWAIDGPGETVINGNFTTTTGFGVNITQTGNGTLTLGTNGATSNWNQAGNVFDLDRGTLKFSANNAIPTTFGAFATTTSATVPISATTYTVASTAGLVAGQTFTGTNVPAGSQILTIDSPTTFTTTIAPTTEVASGAALSFAASGGLTISPDLATTDTATLNLNGTTQTVNAFTATTDGAVVIDNTSATSATFTFGANNSTVSITNTGARTITDSGVGALSIVKAGNTALTLPTSMTLTYQGSTSSTGGGSFTINSALNGTSGLMVTGSSTLALPGGLTAPGVITSIEVGGGSTLSFLDGTGSAIANLTNLNLGAGTGTATLNLNVGDSIAVGDFLNTDTLTLVTTGTLSLANTVTFNLTDAGLNPSTTYTLLNLVDGGITAFGAGNMIQGAMPGGFSGFSWTVTNNVVQLTTGTLITGSSYWRGLTDNTWNANANNWSTDKAGTIQAASIPGSGTDVVFGYDGIAAAPLTTTLEQNIKINSLTFEAGTSTPTSVTIAPGAVSTNRLEVAPQVATDGVRIIAGGPAAATISAPLRLGANQTWNVADAASVLTLSGGLQGEKDVTKTGSGKVTISIAADNAFNTGLTSDFTLNGGTLELTHVDALGVVGKRANVAVNTGAAFYYNGVAGTVANALTLGGGTLSSGTANQIYSGAVNISVDSFINLRDSNSSVPTATQRAVTLSGPLSGTGDITLDSINTVSAGNQITGDLVISNSGNSGWSGDLIVRSGTVTARTGNGDALGTGAINIELGKVEWEGAGGVAYNLNKALTIARSGGNAIAEWNIDRTSGTGAFTVNNAGTLTLGGAGGTGELRIFSSDAEGSVANFTGPVVLANNASIHVRDNATLAIATISGVISESGGARSLIVNGPAGGGTAWGGTAGILRLDAANTYTGGTGLASGTLLMNHVDALSTGALNVTGASTLSSLVDLTGLDALANVLNLSAVLTLTGSNGITFSGTTTNIGAGGITNSLTAGNLLFAQVNLAEAAAVTARTLTIAGASTGTNTITSLLNNDQNNTLTNNLSGAGAVLSIGTIALSESAGTGRMLTLGGTGNTTVTGLIEDVAGGGGVAGILQKTGTGTLTLQGTNTFTGPVNVNGGNLDFSTATNIAGGASNLGAGSVINLGGGTLRFIGSTNQTTDRAINASVNSTLNTSGTGVAEISYTGPVNMGAFQLTLTGASAANAGNLSGGITQTGTTSDILVNSGTWNLTGTNTFSDDVIVTGTTAILNLNSTGTLAYTAGTSNGLYSRDGAVININAANVSGVANSGSLDFILIADTPSGATATVNMASGGTIETPRLDVGSTVNPGRTGNVTGTGLITVTSTATDYLTGIRLFDGSIAANLAGVSSILKQGLADFTLSGNNTGLTGTVAATRIDAGNLILDYTTQNNHKISAVAALDMRGGTLTLNGNNAAATSQTVASFTLANGGANTIDLNAGTGQALVLNLGAITRAATAGTLRVQLPTGTQDATNGITTTTAVNAFGTLGGFLTVSDATGTYFAAKSGNNIIAVTPTVAADVSAWTNGQNIINTGSSFSGTTGLRSINSLSFDNSSGGTITVANTATLDLFNGGTLITSNVTGGAPTITGGRLTSTVADIIVTHDGTAPMTINSQIGLSNGVTKAGNGSLLINGAINNYTGATQILSGTLQVSGGNAIGNASSVVLSDDRASTLELLASETIGNLSGGNAGTSITFGTVVLGSNTLNINSTGNATYAGVFTGSGSIVRNGTSGLGNLLFTGNSGAGFTGALVANGGLMYVEGVAAMNASSLTINKGGSFLISNNGTTRSGTRFLDTMPIILNSADGAWATETRPSGLSIRTDQNATTNETVGLLSLASGASYFRGDASGTTGVAGIITSEIVRSNSSTINARGRALGAIAGDRNFLRISSGTANETAFAATLVGGVGAAGSKNISILPWGMGEVTTTNLADNNMGNSLLTYVVTAGSGAGLRPLDFATEYSTFASKTATTDNLRESLAADLTGIVGQTINSLVINNSNTAAGSVNVTGTGAAQTLAVTSGTMLFTAISAVTGTPAIGVNLGGFDGGITVGGTNEYVIFVQNPTSAAAGGTLTATISSPLTSSADITKSGRGTLILSAINAAGGGARKTTLNEGILEISDLDNIGGITGSLVFAGGTLRLGTSLTDDISSRSITFLNGGGAIDTNTVNLVLANSIGSGVGGFTKTGAGTLTLGAASTYTGQTTVSGGTLALTANNATGSGGALVVGAGATLDIGTNSITHSTVTTTGASPIITGAGTIASSGGFNFTHTGDTTVDAVLAGAGGLIKNQTNVVTLNGASTYTGGTEIQNGIVAVSTLANAGSASSLGAPAAGTDASVIRLGLTTAVTGLNYLGTANSSTNRIIAMQGTTGGVALNGNGTGGVDYAGGVAGYSTGAKTLTLSGTSGPTVINRVNGVTDGIGTITLAKSGTNLWELYGSSSYTGATQINEGTLQIGNNNALPVAAAVRLGTGATAGIFDLNGFDQTIGSLTSTTNSGSVTNSIVVDLGKTLTVSGAVTIGANVAAGATTLLNATGGGSFVNNNDGGTFQIGGATGGTNTNVATVDLSGLGNFTVNLGGTGTFRVGDNNTNTSGSPASASTLILASTSSVITAGTLSLGQGTGQGNAVQTLSLGAGTNIINADTINIGGNTTRSGGSLNFAGASGSVVIRATNGTDAAVVNMVNGAVSTGIANNTSFLLSGHNADVLISTMTMAAKTTSTGATTSAITFDQGTLDITTLEMVRNTGAYGGAASATVTIGGGTATIDTVNMALNSSSAAATATANLNVSGGTVTIGTGSGTAINMANASASRSSTSNINLTGGTMEVIGNIVRTAGAGTENATVTVNGGTLVLNGNSIGGGSAVITLAAQSGTLRNLGELNGGGSLTKTTAGVLVLDGANTYTGKSIIDAGKLSISNENNLGANPVAPTADQLTLNGGTLLTTADLTLDDSNRGITISAASSIETASRTTATISRMILGSANLSKEGQGTLVLTALQSGHTGSVTINAGTLAGNGGTGGNLVVNSGGTLAPGTSPGQFTVTGDLTVNSGGTLLFELGGMTTNSAVIVMNEISTNGNLNGLIGSGTVTSWESSYSLVTSQHNQIGVGGTAPAISGNLTLGALLNSYNPAYGDVFDLLDWVGLGPISGSPTFDFNTVTLDPGLVFNTDLFASNGILVVVPEPSRACFILIGLLGLMLRRRRAL